MSIQTSSLPISTLPLSQILRPIPPVYDHAKIDSMICTLDRSSSSEDEPTELPPVDVIHIKSEKKGDMYFAFGGCHRLRAYQTRAERSGEEEMVRVRVLKGSRDMLRMYLGASVDRMLDE
ncbi:sulfiredoxin [Ascobolus immersus RN42]|uniref:Sulfiredoxin n=1 Tax=Ascobolus immersus RN42 TaxID=1160509 RepID=A0A3N4IK62_ASCIM|nr:sulfiredoxin [Ascobolus immersus RN42]